MNLVIGPVLRRADGYAFDTWTAGKGVTRSYPYHRIEHAYYARDAEIKASARGRDPAAIACQTFEEFIVKLTGDEYPIDNVYLAAKNPWLQRQLHTPLGLGGRPLACRMGRAAAAAARSHARRHQAVQAVAKSLHDRAARSRLSCARPPQHPWNNCQRSAHRRSLLHR